MAAASSSQHRCVFVGNIPYDATEEQLIQICEEVGPVVSFRLVIDRETGKPKGYGFCEYKDEETALSARRNLQGYEINGRQLRVDFAENDKGTVNREQGRGGPGFTSTNDSNAQKLLPRPPNPGDSSFHQPVGHPLAVTTASAMARALGGPQTSGLPLMQNGLQNHSGVGNDPLSQYLGKMSRQQLNEIMSEMKTLAVQNKALAQQLLQGCPQLPKALFQAQIMLGMVTPQMMQMANSGQSSSSVQRLAIQNSMPNQNPLLPSHPGQTLSQKGSLVGPLVRPPESQVSSALQNPSVLQQLSIPVQPPFQHHLPPKPKTFLQGTLPDKYGITTEPQNISSLSNQPQIQPLPTSNNLISQVKPPVLQHPKPPGDAVVGHHPQPFIPDSQRQSYLPYPMTSQSGPANYPVLANGLNSLSKEAGAYASTGHDSAWVSTGSIQSTSGVGLTAQTRTSERSEMMNPRPKRPKLEDGSGAHLPVTNTLSTSSSFTAPSIVIGSVPGSQIANADVLQHSEKQMPQLPAEVESALLQQVMNLTPEQLSSLPLEQQQQVLQLQQMLVKQNL